MKKFLLFAAALLAMNVSAQNVVLTEDFDGEEIPWMIVDADGDGYNWGIGMWDSDENTTYCAYSNSYVNNTGALTPDNWLISPAFALGASGKLTFDVKGQDPSWAAEHYGVYVTENVDAENFSADDYTSLFEAESTANWENIEVDLAAYQGKTIRVAFRHWNITDMFIIKMDNIKVTDEANTAISDVRANAEESNVWYDLQGRKYNEKPAAAGLYINNGKKVLVK